MALAIPGKRMMMKPQTTILQMIATSSMISLKEIKMQQMRM
jgi:hypothetical protein